MQWYERETVCINLSRILSFHVMFKPNGWRCCMVYKRRHYETEVHFEFHFRSENIVSRCKQQATAKKNVGRPENFELKFEQPESKGEIPVGTRQEAAPRPELQPLTSKACQKSSKPPRKATKRNPPNPNDKPTIVQRKVIEMTESRFKDKTNIIELVIKKYGQLTDEKLQKQINHYYALLSEWDEWQQHDCLKDLALKDDISNIDGDGDEIKSNVTRSVKSPNKCTTTSKPMSDDQETVQRQKFTKIQQKVIKMSESRLKKETNITELIRKKCGQLTDEEFYQRFKDFYKVVSNLKVLQVECIEISSDDDAAQVAAKKQ